MQIGIDIRLTYHRQGGISWYAIRLVHALAKIDPDNDYVLLQHHRQAEPLIEAPNFRRVRLYAPVHHRFEQWPLSLETRRLGLDLIHSPDFIPPLRHRIPSVITVHDLGFLLYPNFVTAEAARYYGQTEVAVRRANRIIAVSQSTRRDLIKILGAPEEKIHVVYEAADPLFQPCSRDEATTHLRSVGLAAPEEFLLFVGTIEPRKNLGTLLRSYHLLRRSYNVDLPLLLVGAPGWLAQDIYELVGELDLEGKVFFLANIAANESLRALYNLSTMLVHPAYYEGFGLTPLEAMACGTPVVCSDAGSLPEVVGDAALLVPPDDVEGWAVAMQRLLADADLRARLRQRGLARASVFSWEKAARETLDIYRQVVASG